MMGLILLTVAVGCFVAYVGYRVVTMKPLDWESLPTVPALEFDKGRTCPLCQAGADYLLIEYDLWRWQWGPCTYYGPARLIPAMRRSCRSCGNEWTERIKK